MSNIHLLKMMTLELRAIQVLQAVSVRQCRVEGFDVRNVDGGMEGGRLWLRRLLKVGIDGRQHRRGGIAGSLDGGADLLVRHFGDFVGRLTRDWVRVAVAVV